MNVFLGAPIAAQDIEILNNLTWQAHPHWQKHPHIRWTAPQNHHMTLHFFGQILPDSLNGWLSLISQELKSIGGFSIKIKKIHNFPKSNSDLVAAYVELNSDLAHLYNRIEQSLLLNDLPVEDRPYLPHITLCRSKQRHILTMSPIIMDFKIEITHVALYQSKCIEGINYYLPLHQWILTPAEHGRGL